MCYSQTADLDNKTNPPTEEIILDINALKNRKAAGLTWLDRVFQKREQLLSRVLCRLLPIIFIHIHIEINMEEIHEINIFILAEKFKII